MAIRSSDATNASVMNKQEHLSSNPAGSLADVAAGSSKTATLQRGATDGVSRKRSRLRRLMVGIVGLSAIGLMVTGTTGCSLTSGVCRKVGDHHLIDDFMVGHRNRVMAEKAWHCQKHRFCNRRHAREFKQGFMDGFIAIAQGGDGCIPSVAPKQFWGWRYQSAQGQGAVNSWFGGYPHGVAAAESSGIGSWGNIRTVGGLGPQAHSGLPENIAPINPFYADGSEEAVDTMPVEQDADGDSVVDSKEAGMMNSEQNPDSGFDLEGNESDQQTPPPPTEVDGFDFGGDNPGGDDEDSAFNGAPIFQEPVVIERSSERHSEAMTKSVGDLVTDLAIEGTDDSFEDSLENLFADEEDDAEAYVAALPAAIESQLSDQESASNGSASAAIEEEADALPFSFE